MSRAEAFILKAAVPRPLRCLSAGRKRFCRDGPRGLLHSGVRGVLAMLRADPQRGALRGAYGAAPVLGVAGQ